MNLRNPDDILDESFRNAREGKGAARSAREIAEVAIRQAQLEAVEAAAKIADPPLWHRVGPPGLWRRRRAKIARDIRALLARAVRRR